MVNFPTAQLTVLNIDESQIEIGDGQGGSFTVPRSTLGYIIDEGGHSEQQYLIYQIAMKLADLNVNLGNAEAIAQAIGDMIIIK
jgi:hypothetical protein